MSPLVVYQLLVGSMSVAVQQKTAHISVIKAAVPPVVLAFL